MSDLQPCQGQYHQSPTCGYGDRRDKILIIMLEVGKEIGKDYLQLRLW